MRTLLTWRNIPRLIIFAVLWWALTEGDTYNLWFAIIMVIAATGLSLVLQPRVGIRPLAILTMLPFLLRLMVVGGWDVSRRALAPNLPIAPGFIDLAVWLPEGVPRSVLAVVINLTPGTVSVAFQCDSLRLHVLDTRQDIAGIVNAMQERLGRVFDLTAPADRSRN